MAPSQTSVCAVIFSCSRLHRLLIQECGVTRKKEAVLVDCYYYYGFYQDQPQHQENILALVGARAPKSTSAYVMCYSVAFYLTGVCTAFSSTFGLFFANAGSIKKQLAI